MICDSAVQHPSKQHIFAYSPVGYSTITTMGSKRGGGSGRSLSLKTNNKLRRQQMYVEDKREATKSRHEERHRRKKEEDKDPELRRERLARNQTMTIEKKRVWDEDADEDTLGAAVDLAQAKRRRLEEAAAELQRLEQGAEDAEKEDDDADSMLGSEDEEEDDNEDDDDEEDSERVKRIRRKRAQRDASLAPSVAASLAPSTTSTNLDLTPASLARKFPNLFSDEPLPSPKVLVTTSLHATIHKEAQDIATLFPNSHYIPRSAHRHGHKYSVREICKFARNREFTAVVVINEDQKTPDRMTIVHLPDGPTLTYTISHYMPGKKIPGHGNPTNHYVRPHLSPILPPEPNH